MAIDVDEYVSSFRPELMEFAAEWALGARFVDIQQRSEYFEASINSDRIQPSFLSFINFRTALVQEAATEVAYIAIFSKLEL